MMLAYGALLLVIGARSQEFGVCYTRNMVLESHRTNATEVMHKLRNVILSASSVKKSSPRMPVCLFTDAPQDLVEEAVLTLLPEKVKVFDLILRDGYESFVPRTDGERLLVGTEESFFREEKETSKDILLRERRVKIRSRLGRILNLGVPPYELTLYADDDTWFCGSTPVEEAMRDLYRWRDHYDVRAKVFAKRPVEEYFVTETQRCVWNRVSEKKPFSAGLHTKCADRSTRGASFCSGAQGGAFAIRKGPRALRFASDFLNAYLHYYEHVLDINQELNHSSYAGRSFGGDQPPLAKLMEDHCDLKNQSAQVSKLLAAANAKAAKADDKAARKRPLRTVVNDQDPNPTTWSFGPLPSAFNVRDTERSKGRCVAPIFGPLILLHHKRYVNHGNLSEATKRLENLCRHSNRPHHLGGVVWLGSRLVGVKAAKGGAVSATDSNNNKQRQDVPASSSDHHHRINGACAWMHAASSSTAHHRRSLLSRFADFLNFSPSSLSSSP